MKANDMLAIKAILQNFKGLADGTIRITFDSNELSGDEVGKIHSMRNKFGWLVFTGSEDIPNPEDIPSQSAERDNVGRSKSQRQRAIIKLIGELERPDLSIEEYYDLEMDIIFKWLQKKLDRLKK